MPESANLVRRKYLAISGSAENIYRNQTCEFITHIHRNFSTLNVRFAERKLFYQALIMSVERKEKKKVSVNNGQYNVQMPGPKPKGTL